MSKRFLQTALLAVALVSFSQAAEAPMRIMPLGDSNTQGYSVPTYFSGYRDLLYALLADAGYNVDFVGTLVDTQNASIPDPHHEGHGGFRIDQINSALGGWLNRIDDPDVVLLMIGTNDFLQNYQTGGAPNRLRILVENIATLRPYAKILVASIVPNTANASIESAQLAFNATIPGMVQDQVAQGRDVYFVDVHAGVTAADMSSDGIHPNETGYDKIANIWLDAITAVIAPAGSDEPPQIARVEPIDATHVAVTFSKPVADSSGNPANFSLSPTATISAAALDAATKRVVTLTTSALARNTSYTLTVSGVRDRTPAATLIAPGSTFGFVMPIIPNGSFEFDYSAWTQTGNQSIVSLASPYHLRKGVGFNGGQSAPNAVLSQTFPTVPGQSYRLQFGLGVVAYNRSEQRLLCAVEGNAPLLSQTVSILGRGNGVIAWEPKSFTFVADSTSATLRFQDVSPTSSNLDMLLDYVRIEPENTRALTVASSPVTGVGITVAPADTNGAANGTTQFVRHYNNGAVVNLTAPATVGANAFQKWQRDGADYSTNTAISVTMNASYTLTAVYGGGGVPVITAEPQPLTAAVGSSASFSVTVSGSTPLTYQWRFNGANISGATAATYTIASVAAAHAGDYSVVVSNGSGTDTSVAAALSVVSTGRLANGSFESDFAAWTATGNQQVVSLAAYPPTHGSNLNVFNGGNSTPNGVLIQRFTTTPGETYTLQFDAGVKAFNPNEQRLQVVVDGSSPLVSQTLSLVGTSGGAIRWVAGSYTFTANSAVTTLTFRDTSTSTANLDMVLDNVRVDVPAAPVARTLTVTTSPSGSLAIAVSPADNNGAGNGTTNFTRVYHHGTAVNLTAPVTSGSNSFLKWQRNGVDFSTNRAITATLDADYTFTAVYQPPAGAFTNGSFESDFVGWTTSGNVAIANAAPYQPTHGTRLAAFNAGQSTPNGVLTQSFQTTPGETYALEFDVGVLAYNNNQQRLQVSVQGAATLLSETITVARQGTVSTRWIAAGYVFTADSATTTLTFRDVSTTSASIDLILDHVSVAVAAPPANRTLTVNSSPASGVAITVSPADTNGAANGSTSFSRAYAQGATVNLTAPTTSGGAAFSKWQRDGVDFSTNAAISVTMDADHTLTAVYTAPASAFTNGSFENGFTGWTVSGNAVLASGGSYAATDGTQTVVMNGGQTTPNGIVAQTFSTTPGQTYTLAFDMGIVAFNNNQQRLNVTVQGVTTLLNQTITLQRLSSSAVRWAAQTFTFVADGTSTSLTFRDASTTSTNIDLMLDHVRVD